MGDEPPERLCSAFADEGAWIREAALDRGQGTRAAERGEHVERAQRDDLVLGLRARVIWKESREDGTHYLVRFPGENEMQGYTPKLGSLVLPAAFDGDHRRSRYQWVQIEFPLRPAKRSVGRVFAWDLDHEDYKAVSRIIWDRLDEGEARAYLQLWNEGYRSADTFHKYVHPQPADPELGVPEEF